MTKTSLHIGAYPSNPKVVIKNMEVCHFFRMQDVVVAHQKEARVEFLLECGTRFTINYSFASLVGVMTKLGFRKENGSLRNPRYVDLLQEVDGVLYLMKELDRRTTIRKTRLA